MKILFDITHPAHIHFFKNAIKILLEQKVEIIVTSRKKEVATELLDALRINHKTIPHSTARKKGLLIELITRTAQLSKFIRHEKPNVIVAVGGIFAVYSAIASMQNCKTMIFYATERAVVHNLLTFPLANRIVVPNCYYGWTPSGKTLRYEGFHELAYLAPSYFSPSRSIAIANGITPDGDNFFIRLVGWQSNHDVGANGMNTNTLYSLLHFLSSRGQIIISSERPLPAELEGYRYRGSPENIHHVLAYCRLVIGESSTMVAEAATLGRPAIFAARDRRGFIDMLDEKFHLVKRVDGMTSDSLIASVQWALSLSECDIRIRWSKMIAQCIDLTSLICSELETLRSN